MKKFHVNPGHIWIDIYRYELPITITIICIFQTRKWNLRKIVSERHIEYSITCLSPKWMAWLLYYFFLKKLSITETELRFIINQLAYVAFIVHILQTYQYFNDFFYYFFLRLPLTLRNKMYIKKRNKKTSLWLVWILSFMMYIAKFV